MSANVGDFNNPSRAKALAQGLYGRGADVVLQLAGTSGLGVIEAAREQGNRYVGLAEGATGLSGMPHTGHLLTARTREMLDRAREGIVTGEIAVPAMADVADFPVPKL